MYNVPQDILSHKWNNGHTYITEHCHCLLKRYFSHFHTDQAGCYCLLERKLLPLSLNMYKKLRFSIWIWGSLYLKVGPLSIVPLLGCYLLGAVTWGRTLTSHWSCGSGPDQTSESILPL